MAMEMFEIIPTSATSADCTPVVLRETTQRRLVFKPMLVESEKDPEAPLRGIFVFQRKRKADGWEDHNEVPLTTLRADEWIRLELSSQEVQTLLAHMAALYREHARRGVPSRRIRLLKVELAADDAEAAARLDFSRILQLAKGAGVDVFGQFLAWSKSSTNTAELLRRLMQVSAADLERVGDLTRVAHLKSVVEEWTARLHEGDEEYWQRSLSTHADILSQVAGPPLVVIKDKAYVGGKSVDNRGGQIVDFLLKNPLTGDAALVELKTPNTTLLGREYRSGVYPLSESLIGAVTQVLTYRNTLTKHYHSLASGDPAPYQVFSPRALVISGNAREELDTDAKRRSFELGRSEFKDVQILTFDELVDSASTIVRVLENSI